MALALLVVALLGLTPGASAHEDSVVTIITPIVWHDAAQNQTFLNLSVRTQEYTSAAHVDVGMSNATFRLAYVRADGSFHNHAPRVLANSAAFGTVWWTNVTLRNSSDTDGSEWRGLNIGARVTYSSGVGGAESHIHTSAMFLPATSLLQSTGVVNISGGSVEPAPGHESMQGPFGVVEIQQLQGFVAFTATFDEYLPFLVWGGLAFMFLYFVAWFPAVVCMMALAATLFPTPLWSHQASVMFVMIAAALHVLAVKGMMPIPRRDRQ